MKKLLISALLLGAAMTSFAQTENTQDKQVKKKAEQITEVEHYYGPFQTNRFIDNWFIDLGVGPTAFFGGQNGDKFSKRIRPMYQFSFGKWFTPTIGVRAQFSFASDMREYSSAHRSPFSMGMNAEGYTLQKFNFFNAHVDILWNWTNEFCGYRADRIYNAIPFLGVGYGILFRDGINTEEFTANVGLINKFEVSPLIDINLEIGTALAKGTFDASSVYNLVDAPIYATVGVTFNVGHVKGFKRAEKPDYLPYENRINELESENKALEARNDELRNTNNQLINREPQVVEKEVVKTSPLVLFFDMNKATLSSRELANFDYYVKHVVLPNEDKVFRIDGSADNATGSKAYNKKLSQKRMEYIVDLLINKYNVSPDRLVKIVSGDENGKFQEAELNRNVVIVE